MNRHRERRRIPVPCVFFSIVAVWAMHSLILASLDKSSTISTISVPSSIMSDFTGDLNSPVDILGVGDGDSGDSRAKSATTPTYHVIFSSGCSQQQHWESYVFFYHAFKVQQPGNVTRLVSGCTPDQEKELRQYHTEKIQSMSPRFHVFFTPEFGLGKSFEGEYKYNNKPNSVFLWMKEVLGMGQNDQPQTVENDIIFLLDPDMILTRPLPHDFSREKLLYASTLKQGTPIPANKGSKVVVHGNPMAQQDRYLTDEWTEFDNARITKNGGSYPDFSKLEPELHWNSGPPYLATVKDMWNMASLWKEYVPRVYEQYPKLFAEMYGLIIAAVQLDLPHTLFKSLVVSDTEANEWREGWAAIDALPDDQVCNVESWRKRPDMPFILHYCKRYLLEKFFFSKYRLKRKFISCETPLLTMPPHNLHLMYHHWVRPPPDRGFIHEMETRNISSAQSKREAFMLCGLIHSVNEAARYYKENHCNGLGNFSEVYNFHDDPNS